MRLTCQINNAGNVLVLSARPLPQIKDGKYQVDIKEIGKDRTLQQNAKLWALIGDISKKQNGDLRDVDDIYLQLLEMSGAKYEILTLKENAFNDKALERFGIRRYKVIKERNGFVSVIAYYGSSTFNTKEMSNLIETTIRYASECGVDVDYEYWKDVLNECK